MTGAMLLGVGLSFLCQGMAGLQLSVALVVLPLLAMVYLQRAYGGIPRCRTPAPHRSALFLPLEAVCALCPVCLCLRPARQSAGRGRRNPFVHFDRPGHGCVVPERLLLCRPVQHWGAVPLAGAAHGVRILAHSHGRTVRRSGVQLLHCRQLLAHGAFGDVPFVRHFQAHGRGHRGVRGMQERRAVLRAGGQRGHRCAGRVGLAGRDAVSRGGRSGVCAHFGRHARVVLGAGACVEVGR